MYNGYRDTSWGTAGVLLPHEGHVLDLKNADPSCPWAEGTQDTPFQFSGHTQVLGACTGPSAEFPLLHRCHRGMVTTAPWFPTLILSHQQRRAKAPLSHTPADRGVCTHLTGDRTLYNAQVRVPERPRGH